MLVVSRKVGESLLIGDNIRITVVSVSGDKISLGIDAPREITVLRAELAETIGANKDSAHAITESLYQDMAALLRKK